jgi:hypothetical protein
LQYGLSIAAKMQSSKVEEYTIDVEVQEYREFIDQTKILLEAAKQVSYDIGCGLPEKLLDPHNRFKDDIGYFWSGITKWDTDLNTVINFGLEFINLGMAFSSNLGDPVNEGKKQELLNYAETLWKQP